jgi:hypothetical protein
LNCVESLRNEALDSPGDVAGDDIIYSNRKLRSCTCPERGCHSRRSYGWDNGVKKGDIITAVNGVKIGSAGSVSSLIGEYRAGDSVKLTIIRDGKEIELTTVLDAYSS